MLTIDEVFLKASKSGLKPKHWGSYRLKTYNGFTHEQRVHKWQALNLAIQMGLVQQAHLSPCSVCGKIGGQETIAYHSEDYGSMFGHHPICKGCHTRVHNRFTNPQRWLEYIEPFCNGSKWFENISTVEQVQLLNQTDSAPIFVESEVTDDCSHSVTFIPPAKSTTKITLKASPNICDTMHQIRIAFTMAIGLDWAENPNPNSGYKFEHNLIRRQQFLDEAIRLRDQYAEMVNKTCRNKGILEKMDRNLENRDRKTAW